MGRCLRLLGLACLLGTSVQGRAGDDGAEALAGTTFFGYGKAMYVFDDKKGGRPNQNTAGFGGKLGLESGDYRGWRLRAAWYTTQDLGLARDNPRQTDAYMFGLDKRPYSLWGEAQLIYSRGRSRLTLGRQEIQSPLINSYEYRIIPNLFDAYVLSSRELPGTTLTLGYVGQMSGLDGLVSFSDFRSMSQQTYTSLLVDGRGRPDARNGETLDPSTVVGHRGVWMTGVAYEGEHKLQLWHYYGRDTLQTVYADGRFKQPLGRGFTALIDGQAYRVSEVGAFRDYLARHGLNASYGLAGLKGTLAHAPSGLSLALMANRFGGDQRTVTAYGNWGGYPEFVLMPYLYAENDAMSAIARSRLRKATLLLDLGPYGLPEHSLLLGHARMDIDEAILPGADIIANSLIYRARLTPRVSARLHLEARSSAHSRYDNHFLTLGLRYDF